jgi:hypothetical protein
MLTSWNPLGLSRPVMGLLYLYLQFLATCHKKEIVPGRMCKTTLLETIKSVYEY